jgi:hypothetical protein
MGADRLPCVIDNVQRRTLCCDRYLGPMTAMRNRLGQGIGNDCHHRGWFVAVKRLGFERRVMRRAASPGPERCR